MRKYGRKGDDKLRGSQKRDLIDGRGGDDRIMGERGDDILIGGLGRDRIQGGRDDDTIYGGFRDGRPERGPARDILYGESGNDRLFGGRGSDRLDGGSGRDRLDGGSGADVMAGGAQSDVYVVDHTRDLVVEAEGEGYDHVYASVWFSLEGQAVERLVLTGTRDIGGVGNALANVIVGNDGDNAINGKAGGDTMRGGKGDDRYAVDTAADRVIEAAGEGNDTIYTAVSYRLAADALVETLRVSDAGGTASTVLVGNDIANTLIGNAGNNVLDGQAGADTLHGLSGRDTFLFRSALGSGNVDHIADFSHADDTIRLDADVFAGLAQGQLAAKAFKETSGGAVDADDRILYDRSTGILSFDADGSGAGSAVAFAVLDTRPAIGSGDFYVV